MKIKYSRLILIFMTIIAIIVSSISIYAWHFYKADVNGVTLQVTRIDSAIYVYQGIDRNYNGIPDLLSGYSQQEIASIQEGYPQNKREYYSENKAFTYLGYKYAMSTEFTDEQKISYTITDMYPTMVSTLKMSVINNSDGNNWISFSFDEKNFSEADLNLLRCLSVKVGVVRNNTGNVSSSDITVTMSDKYYFNDGITTNFDGLNVIDGEESIEVKGLVNRDVTINDDICDLWFQFEFESYEALVNHANSENANEFTMTNQTYQSLQNKTINLPDLKVLLEVRI